MVFETEYELESVAATRVAADDIDGTFRSSTIGRYIAKNTPCEVESSTGTLK